jgi:hypothetical protein
MVIVFAVVGIILCIFSFVFLMDDYSPKRGLLGMALGIFIICGGLFHYNYTLMHSDPTNVYTDVDAIDDGNNLGIIVYQCIPIPFQPDKCEKVDSFVVGKENITSYITKIQKAYNK